MKRILNILFETDYLNSNGRLHKELSKTRKKYLCPRSRAIPFAFDKFVIRYLRDTETSSA